MSRRVHRAMPSSTLRQRAGRHSSSGTTTRSRRSTTPARSRPTHRTSGAAKGRTIPATVAGSPETRVTSSMSKAQAGCCLEQTKKSAEGFHLRGLPPAEREVPAEGRKDPRVHRRTDQAGPCRAPSREHLLGRVTHRPCGNAGYRKAGRHDLCLFVRVRCRQRCVRHRSDGCHQVGHVQPRCGTDVSSNS